MTIVSIGVLALNEEAYLPALLEDIQAQTYPREKIEILLIDSQSTDKTRQIMENFAERATGYFNVKILPNMKITQAEGWNVAIKNFKGDVLTRLDAHGRIPRDFIELNVKNIDAGEMVSGGVSKSLIIGDSNWSKTLLQVENSLFGSGFNLFHRALQKQYVKTMPRATYHREVIEQVGFFNTRLGRTEDNEFHYRIRTRGFKLCLDPTIVSYLYVRPNLFKMLKQKYGNGYWVGLTLSVCPACLSVFYFVPFLFVLAICFSLAMASAGIFIPGILLAGAYSFVSIMMTLISIQKNGVSPYSIVMPILFFLLHLAYGIGTLIGFCTIPIFMREMEIKSKVF